MNLSVSYCKILSLRFTVQIGGYFQSELSACKDSDFKA